MWRWKKRGSDVDASATTAALVKAEGNLRRAQSRWPIVNQIAADLAAARMENNFAARIRAAYGEGR